MLLKITRGLGGRKGITILVLTGLAGLVAVLAAWLVRDRLMTVPPPAAIATSPEEVLRLGERARGPMPDVLYKPNDLARVASFAVAQRSNQVWDGLPAGSVLRVTATRVEKGQTWVEGVVEGGLRTEPVVVHGSFLERYQPLVLDNVIELSDVRLVHVREVPTPQMTVSGWLRNVSGRTISQVVVSCTFQDKNQRRIDRRLTGLLTLPHLQFVRFETEPTDQGKYFTSMTLEISYGSPDGLMHYLPSVVIARGPAQ